MEEDLSKKSVAELLQTYDTLVLQPNNRIKCKITGHEMPPQVNAIVQHLQGQRYKKALAWYSHDYSQYQPYIVDHKSDSRKLFCTLTKQVLNKIPQELEKHMNGKRFLRLKKEAEESSSKQNDNNNDDEDPDCWVPEALSDSDKEEKEAVDVTVAKKGKRKKQEVDSEEEEEVDQDSFEDDDNEENNLASRKGAISGRRQPINKKGCQKKESSLDTTNKDDDDVEYIIRSVSKAAKKQKHRR